MQQVFGKLFIPRPSYNNSKIHETDSRGLGTEPGSVEAELRGRRIHDTLETGLQMSLCSLVALHKEVSADLVAARLLHVYCF